MKRITLFNKRATVGISDLSDGNMRSFSAQGEATTLRNQAKFVKAIGLAPDAVARLRVTYGERNDFTDYREITKNNDLRATRPTANVPSATRPMSSINDFSIAYPAAKTPACDGLITRDSDLGILLPLADCLGVVVFDPKRRALGVLHAGRHNIEQNGPTKFIEFFCKSIGSNPTDLLLYFSPCARNYRIFALDNATLPGAAREQFAEAGVLTQNIIDSAIDTVTSSNLPSHSSGDTDVRFAIVARML